MDCKIPRRREKHPLENKLQRGRCSFWESLRMAELDAKHPRALDSTSSHQAQVPGEVCPWEHSWTRSLRDDGDKIHPKHKESPVCLAKAGLWEGNGLMHPLLTVQGRRHSWAQHPPQGDHSQPWHCWIHPRHFSGAPWLVGLSWGRTLGFAGSSCRDSDPSRAGRSGGDRERIYLHQEGAWIWELKSCPCLEEEPLAP